VIVQYNESHPQASTFISRDWMM